MILSIGHASTLLYRHAHGAPRQPRSPVDLRAVTAAGRPCLPGGCPLLDFVEALVKDRRCDRRMVADILGAESAVVAAAVTGNFQMMNRVADTASMPVGSGTRRREHELITLGLDRFDHHEERP